MHQFGKFVPDCVTSNLRGSKFKNFPWGGGGVPQDPHSMHTHISVHEHACYYHLATVLFPPNSKSYMKSCSGIVAPFQEVER